MNEGKSVRVLKSVDGAGLRVGGARPQTVVAGEGQVGHPRIAVSRWRTVNAQQLIDIPPFVLIVPPLLPAVVAHLRLVYKCRGEGVGPIHPRLVEPVHAPGTKARHARGQARRSQRGFGSQAVAKEETVLRAPAVVKATDEAVRIDNAQHLLLVILSPAGGIGDIGRRISDTIKSSVPHPGQHLFFLRAKSHLQCGQR